MDSKTESKDDPTKETKQSKEDREVVRKYKAAFKGAQGKAVLIDMCKNAGLFSPPASLDPQDLAYSAGQRATIISIINILDMDYEDVLKLFTSNTYLGDEGEEHA